MHSVDILVGKLGIELELLLGLREESILCKKKAHSFLDSSEIPLSIRADF